MCLANLRPVRCVFCDLTVMLMAMVIRTRSFGVMVRPFMKVLRAGKREPEE